MMNLKPETLAKIEEVITHYPVKRSAALPLLHLVQEDQGFISNEAIEWIAAEARAAADKHLRAGDVLPDVPAEARRAQAHQGLPHAFVRHDGRLPHLLGVPEAVRHRPGRGFPRRRGDVEFVECLASCGTAPVVMVDDELHEKVDVAKAGALGEIKAEAKAAAGEH